MVHVSKPVLIGTISAIAAAVLLFAISSRSGGKKVSEPRRMHANGQWPMAGTKRDSLMHAWRLAGRQEEPEQ